jgi:O-antigen/teichoic acid export membrane protein
MSFLKKSFSTFLAQTISVVLGVITSIIVSRWLQPEGKGILSLVILIPTLLSTIGSLGIGVSNVYYGGKKKYTWEALASNSLFASFFIGVFLIILFIFYYIYFNPTFLKNISPKYIIISIIILPCYLIISYFQNILLGQDRIKEYNSISILQSIIYLILIVILMIILHDNLWGAVLASMFMNIIISILAIFLVYKKTAFQIKINLILFWDTIKFGIQGQLSNIIQLFNYRLDMIFVNMFLNAINVGYYSIAVSLAEALWYFPSSVGIILFTQTPKNTTSYSNYTTPKICRNTFFLTLILAVLLALIGKYIILILFGPAYLPSYKALLFLLPGIVSLSVCKVLSNELTGRGKPIVNVYANGISLLTNIPLNILLIPRMGIIGSALSSSISYTFGSIIVLYMFINISHNTLFNTLVINKEDIKMYYTILQNAVTKSRPTLSNLNK